MITNKKKQATNFIPMNGNVIEKEIDTSLTLKRSKPLITNNTLESYMDLKIV